ncbi:MAG: choice-of-anchor B family protein, partial [Cryomorphaceae bacterium]|nr:choice-of-anchor B family protein [Flavobacteriales bacterium]
MKLKILFALAAVVVSKAVFAQPCTDGLSGDFPCDLIDQESFLPLIDFQTENLNDIWGWTSPETGREYAIQGAHNKTAFIDISSPAYPIYLGYLPTATTGSLWRDVKVVDNYAYIVSEAEQHGMQVFDLTRLESLLASEIPLVFDADALYNGFGNCHNIVADTANKFVYAVGTGTFSGGPHIIDVQDPLNPTYAGSNAQAGYTHDAQVFTYTGPDQDHVGKEICVGFNEDIIAVYDATDKTDVNLISTEDYDNVGYVHQGWFTEDQRYMISNDETDELDFGINTRSILWDMQNLDNPQVIDYVDLGTPSVDHNLYIKGDMVYESNYTTGLRVLDILEIEDGHLEPFGFYDVFPQADLAAFFGSWSNYPYFESGVIAVSNMYGSFHALRPRFYEFDQPKLKVCSEEQASLEFSINKRMFGDVSYAVEMADEGTAGLNPQLLMNETDGAPAQNTISFSGLNALEPGYYPGEMVVTYSLGTDRIPFVLIKDDGETLESPVLIAPSNETLPDQLVDFSFTDPTPGYAVLQ